MGFRKEVIGNELYLYNGKNQLIFKRWLDTNRSLVFDIQAYDKYTLVSITDSDIKQFNSLRAIVYIKNYDYFYICFNIKDK